MRIASWVFVLCAALGAIALFLPSLQVELKGHAIKQSKYSIYKISTERDRVARLVHAYQNNKVVGFGGAAAVVLANQGKSGAVPFDDIRDAHETIEGLTSEDLSLGGKAIVALVWVLLGLHVISLVLVAGEQMRETGGGVRGRRIAFAAVLGVLAGAIAIAVNIGCRMVREEAADTVPGMGVELGSGQYLMLGAAVVGLGALAVVVVGTIRDVKRRKRAA